MSVLIIFGAKVNWDNEIEIMSEDEFGMDIKIDFKDGRRETRNNCTEFHHLFKSIFEPASAFESDIHSTGGTREIDTMDKIVVKLATKKHKNH